MESKYLIKPDTKFVKEVIDRGGESVKKCFQCGTCSAVCSLSPDERPFPRKEMIWAQWGLKDKLLKDPDVWLCHQCNDCSTYCPRDAKPGDVLAAIRSYSIMHLALPGFMAKALSAPRYLPFVLALPALFLFIFLQVVVGGTAFPMHAEVISPGHYISVDQGHIGMLVIVIMVFTVAAIGIRRFWKNINEFGAILTSTSNVRDSFIKALVFTIIEILKHSKFSKCEANKTSRLTHLAIFYGFILAMLAAFFGALYHFAGIESPYPQLGPVKIAGNLGGILIFIGCVMAIYRRLSKSSDLGKTTYFDWFLLLTLFFVNITGFATEIIRLMELAAATYWIYLSHIWLMSMLLVYAPFSKGAHIIYRTLAMTYARQIGRNVE